MSTKIRFELGKCCVKLDIGLINVLIHWILVLQMSHEVGMCVSKSCTRLDKGLIDVIIGYILVLQMSY